jgi:hypothetical protein
MSALPEAGTVRFIGVHATDTAHAAVNAIHA